MTRRSPRFALLLLLMSLVGLAAPGPALAAAPTKAPKPTVFEACHRSCRYRTIQKAVDAAGGFAYRNKKAKVIVAIRPGTYVEGVVLDGSARRRRFDGMTIEGTSKDPKRTVLEGVGARGELGAAPNGIEAIGIERLVLKNIWARNFESNGVLVRPSGEAAQDCRSYTMNDLLVSGNHDDGVLAADCLGGRIINSAGYHQGDAAFAVGETPCDNAGWNVYSGEPCQSTPRWTLLQDDRSYENARGFSGVNAKYLRLLENAFYDNGTGIVLATIDNNGHEPNGWNAIEGNDVFWNNYDYFLSGSAFQPTAEPLGEWNGRPLAAPLGVGIAVDGGDADIVRGNGVFGNYKWGIASFSMPGESVVVNEGDEAKNVNNEIVENTMGRYGADPNGEYDIWNDASGGGNCWGANGSKSTFAPGNGKATQAQIYPVCPQPKVAYPAARSLNVEAGLQGASTEIANPKTSIGYAATAPSQNQQCSWVRHGAHPSFQSYAPAEVTTRPGEVSC